MRISSSTFGKIRIGKGTTINSCWYSNKAGGGQKKTSLIAEGGEISIGKNVGISNSTIYSRKNIIIEDNVMVGVNCVIYDTDFHSIYIEDRLNENINIIDKNSKIFNIIKKDNIRVNSRHKNVLDSYPLLKVTAVDEDGYPDVVESEIKHFYIGIRFHPESLYKIDENHNNIFKAFIGACDERKNYKK